jgi:hypothetical protein
MASTIFNSTSCVGSGPAAETLVQNWWLFTLRGVLGIIFGILALIFPGPTILSYQNQKGRAPARPLQIETVDEIARASSKLFLAANLRLGAFPSDAIRSPAAREDMTYNIAGSPST